MESGYITNKVYIIDNRYVSNKRVSNKSIKTILFFVSYHFTHFSLLTITLFIEIISFYAKIGNIYSRKCLFNDKFLFKSCYHIWFNNKNIPIMWKKKTVKRFF